MTRPADGPRSRLQLVADAPDRLDVARSDGVRLDLFTEAADMDGDGALVAVPLEVPDVVQELLAREDLPGALGQEVEQVELFGGQVDRLAIALHCPAAGV